MQLNLIRKETKELLKIITVDNSTTTDRDDGISYNKETWLLGIHITIAPKLNMKDIKKLTSTTYDSYTGQIINPMIENYKDFSLDEWTTRQVLSLYIDKKLEVKDIRQEEVIVEKNYSYIDFKKDENFKVYKEFYQKLLDDYIAKWYKEFDFEDIRVLSETEYEIRKSYLSEKIIAMFATLYNDGLTQILTKQNKMFFIMKNKTEIDEHIKSRKQFFNILSKLWRSEMSFFAPEKYKINNKLYQNKLLWLEVYWRLTSPLRRLDDYINQQIYLWNISFNNEEDMLYFVQQIDDEQQQSKKTQLDAKKKVVLKDLEVWKRYKWIITGEINIWTLIAFWDNLEFSGLAYQEFSDDYNVEVVVNNSYIDDYTWQVKVSLNII